jgi:hypothetical protein
MEALASVSGGATIIDNGRLTVQGRACHLMAIIRQFSRYG